MRLNMKATLMAAITLCLMGIVASAETRISKLDLPAAVEKTADEQIQGSTVRGYSTNIENGQLQYEIRMTTNGHSKSVTIAPDGKLLEVEEQIAMEALPGDVKAGLQSKAGTGRIAKIESLTKHGAIVAYEAQVYTAGKHSEIQVGPDGKALDHEE